MTEKTTLPVRASHGEKPFSFFRHMIGNRSSESGQAFFTPVIQPKLSVNAPDDIYEKEADAVADRVMLMLHTPVQRQAVEEEQILQTKELTPAIRRKCDACEAEESLQMQPMEEEEEVMMKPHHLAAQRKCAGCEEEEKNQLMRKPLARGITPLLQRKAGNSGVVGGQLAASLHSAKSGGRPLPEGTRSWMETRFGTDFSHVNVHTDSQAVQLSRDLNAQAFTHGSDIYFNRGRFAPETHEGKRLLAHELTHVVQQNSGMQTENIQRTVARQVGCAPGPFTTSSGTEIADPVEFITEAETSAAGLITEALEELEFTRNRIRGGEEAAWPVIGDTLAFALTLMGLDPGNRDVWTETGIGTVHLLMRRLRAIRGTLEGFGIFYHCDPQHNVNMPPCSSGTCSGGGAIAFSCAGSFRILLCDPFWSRPLNERAADLIHEHAHNFAEFIGDSGREGNAECYARFVIEANGLTSSALSIVLCPDP